MNAQAKPCNAILKKFKYILLFLLLSGNCFSQSNFFSIDTTFLSECRNHIEGPVFEEVDLFHNVSLLKKTKALGLRDSLNPKSSVFLPIGEVLIVNFGLAAFNSYVTKQDYAKISWKTIKHNFDTGFVWSDDDFRTNQFLHPYHGNVYFNTARSNGYNFWESIPFVVGGSWQWEMFMENDPPAINDLITTSLGGPMLGEMLYRISSLVIDESVRGSGRVFREIFAGLINPARGFNRLIHGRSSRHTDKLTNAKLYDREPTYGSLSLGMNNVAEGTSFKEGTQNLLLDLRYAYGKPFIKKKRKPYDFFYLNLGINFAVGDPIGYVNAYGILFGENHTYRNNKESLLGIFQHYDYHSNNVFQIGAQSVGGGLIYEFLDKEDVKLITSLHLAGIILGVSNNEYVEQGKRNFNYSTGISSKFDGLLSFGRARLYLGYLFYWLHSIDGIEGDDYLGIFKPRFLFGILDNWNIGLEYLLYHRIGKYRDFPHVNIQNNEQRLFISYDF